MIVRPFHIYVLICILPIVDLFNGIMIRVIGISAAVPIKVGLLLLMFLILMIYDDDSRTWLLLSCGFALFYTFLHLFMIDNLKEAFYGLSWTIKFLFFYVLYRFFRYCRIVEGITLLPVYVVALLTLVANALISLLGLGYAQYKYGGQAVGSRGLFYAGNELGGMLLLVGLYSLYVAYRSSVRSYLVVSLALLFCASQIGTKVALLGVLMLVMCIPLVFLVSRSRRITIFKKRDACYVVINSFFVAIVGLLSVYFVLFKLNLIARLEYWYHKTNLLTLLFSHRNVWAVEQGNIFLEKASLFNYIFGMSYSFFSFSDWKTVEIDFFDIYFVYGFFGVLFTYGFIIRSVIGASLNYMNSCGEDRARYLVSIVGSFMVVGVSLTAGHIFNSGIALIYLAALFALTLPVERDRLAA